jgi:hypothetical protein
MYGSQARKGHNMKKILLSLIPVGAVAGIALSGLPANAATIQPNAATTQCVGNVCGQCSGDICAQVTSIYRENRVGITVWAYDQNFYGYFTIQTISPNPSSTAPDEFCASPNQTWLAGGGSAGDQVYSYMTPDNLEKGTTITVTALEDPSGNPASTQQIGQVYFPSVVIDPY